MYTRVDQEQFFLFFLLLSSILQSPNPPLTAFASLFLFSILSWPHPSFPIFSAKGLIPFYPGAQQINRYCIMAKTGKAPLCP